MICLIFFIAGYILELDTATSSGNVKLDLSYAFDSTQSVNTLKHRLDEANRRIGTLQKKLKTQQQKMQWKQSQLLTVKDLLVSLKYEKMLSEECEENMECFSNLKLCIIKNMRKMQKKRKCSETIRQFALTLFLQKHTALLKTPCVFLIFVRLCT